MDPTLVSSATVRSDTGALIPMATTGPTWLEGTRVTARANKYDLEDASYSWQSVTVSGTNVVDAGRQDFTPAPTAAVTVVGQFHDLTVVGIRRAAGPRRRRPGGHHPPRWHGPGRSRWTATTRQSSRTCPGAPIKRRSPREHRSSGTTRSGSPVTSRCRAPVISPVDIAILGGSLMVFALGLVLIGRRHLRRRLVAPFRPAALAEAEAR